MSYRIGVDIGGSFADFAVFDEDTKELKSLKVFSRPDKPGTEVLEGIRLIGERYGIDPRDIVYFTHGTTVGINTIIQRSGLKLALFTTENFRDVLELARLKIPDMYNLLSKRPEPLVPRDRVYGIPERIRADGSIQRALDTAALTETVAEVLKAGAEGIVIAFLHSYRNAAHERQAKAVVERIAPGLPVFCSSEVWPIMREYERTITAVVSGYVQPRVAGYLTSLQKALKEAGVEASPRLTKSNGGIMSAEQGKKDCVQMILSGTASGVIGASYVAQTCGIGKCMSLDIGGTSADVAIILDGQPQYGVGEKIGDFQIFIPSVSVTSVGEGGGSVAWVDDQGILRVGPQSAGSLPGPACYGRGGTKATITDAFAVLGFIGHGDLGYNSVQVDEARARAAVAGLAERLETTVERTAEAIIRIAVSGMFVDISGLVSRFGIDPTQYSLLAFGGAGPMMACLLARELRMREVVVPLAPGVLSALGGLSADIKNDFIRTMHLPLEAAAAGDLRAAFGELEQQAVRWLKEDQEYEGDYELIHAAEMRYQGQSFGIDTRLDAAAIETCDLAPLAAVFHKEHERIYGHFDPLAPVQAVSLKLTICGRTEKPQLPRCLTTPGEAVAECTVAVHIGAAERQAGLYRRGQLRPGQSFNGPAVVIQDDCTTVIPPDFRVEVDEYQNLRITLGAGHED